MMKQQLKIICKMSMNNNIMMMVMVSMTMSILIAEEAIAMELLWR